MSMKLGISPCPNDTFVFYHLIHSRQFEIELSIEDIETLNQKVLNRETDISKVSLYTALQIMDHYTLLDAGATLGLQCGPLLVAGSEDKRLSLRDAKIAIPGQHTTAHLLFSLYGKNEGQKVFMPFHQIMGAVKQGLVDFGVLIHEGRFTYQHYGLVEIADLGEWWKEKTGLPLPLGGIVVKKELPDTLVKEFTLALRDSIERALSEKEDHTHPIHAFVQRHAQEMEREVIRKHLDLYVNHYSLSLGEEGRMAIDKLMNMVREQNLT